MSLPILRQHSRLRLPNSRKLLSLLLVLADHVERCAERARQRRRLAMLPDSLLHDLGLGRGDALLEAEKPFWRQ